MSAHTVPAYVSPQAPLPSFAEETCALEACYVAAFRMKLRGLRLHDKLDKAAVSYA